MFREDRGKATGKEYKSSKRDGVRMLGEGGVKPLE
jgi:hypothetical protein